MSTWDPAFDPPHQGEGFDYEGYVQVLEQQRRPVVAPLVIPSLVFPVWRWQPPLYYNGFTPKERIRGWQVNLWAQTNGIVRPPPKACSVCHSIQRVGWHAENYYDLLTHVPLCRACHFVVHGRFRQPGAWLRFQERFGQTGFDAWFQWLPLTQIDLARHLRKELGDQACDPLHSVVGYLRAQSLSQPSNIKQHLR
jgi:hypothetical protein